MIRLRIRKTQHHGWRADLVHGAVILRTTYHPAQPHALHWGCRWLQILDGGTPL